MWYDYRILVNGAAVTTYTSDNYWYRERREDLNPDVIPVGFAELLPLPGSQLERLNVPASATVQAQARLRWAGVGFQTSGYARTIQGYRSRTSYHFSPKTIVTDVS